MTFIDCETIDPKLVKNVVKNYNVLDYTHNLRCLLNQVVPKDELEGYCRLEIHKKINEVIFGSYEGEQVLKYRLFQAFAKADIVAAYEIKVKNSRVDFLTINGHTTSYEIKSSLDTLGKLAKQSLDYKAAFELNNIVVHERHLKKCMELVPDCFGIISIDKCGHEIIKKPVLNKSLNAEVQLCLLTKKELIEFYGVGDAGYIFANGDNASINEQFKLALKKRYQAKWDFIVANSGSIVPIDIQFFFNKNINPRYVYG
jgi:hypothetical protein